MEFLISEKSLNLAMNKLASLPYSEVASIFEEVKAGIRPYPEEKQEKHD